MRKHQREQRVRVEGLPQVAARPRAECELSRCYIVVRRHEDHWKPVTARGDVVAQLEAAEATELDVQHQTAWLRFSVAAQIVFRGGERLRANAAGPDDSCE